MLAPVEPPQFRSLKMLCPLYTQLKFWLYISRTCCLNLFFPVEANIYTNLNCTFSPKQDSWPGFEVQFLVHIKPTNISWLKCQPTCLSIEAHLKKCSITDNHYLPGSQDVNAQHNLFIIPTDTPNQATILILFLCCFSQLNLSVVHEITLITIQQR